MERSDLARLEAHVLAQLDEGREPSPAELRREFPSVGADEIEQASCAARILKAWQSELRERGGDSAGEGEWADRDWLQVGERLGGYVVERRIPGGGMGQVYQAAQESLYPRKVALKVYRLGANPRQDLRRARREAEVASRLVHPHLVAIHDLGHDPERNLAYISMQFVDGSDLRTELRGSAPLRERVQERARVRRQVTRVSEVAGALAELHGRHLVHRDVKPENILLHRNAGRDGQSEAAVLVDFGLVRAERALGAAEALLSAAGTPGYAPPESDRPGHPVTPAWDVYSLGVVLYELLLARPLVRDGAGAPLRPTAAELAALRSAVPAVDADLLAVLIRATDPDPAARYPHAGALQEDLERWLAAEPVDARRAPPHERAWRAARRRPRRALLLLLAAVLLVLLTRSVAWTTDQTRRVRAGEAALASGMPGQGWALLASTRPVLVRLLLGAQDGTVRDLLRGSADQPLSRVALAELERGTSAALHLAAAYLERDGYRLEGSAAHPRLQSFLLRSIAPDALPEVRERALQILARLFYERPLLDRDDLLALEPFRERLRELLLDPAASRDARLHVLCALGGLGGLRELDLLLDRLDAQDPDGAAVRLGLPSIERILRRLRPMEGRERLAQEPWDAREERLIRLLGELRERVSRTPDHLGLAQGSENLHLAWILLHRETGRAIRMREDHSDGAQGDLGRVRMALGADADPELPSRILAIAATREGLGAEPVHRWWWLNRLGELCAYAGDPGLRVKALAYLEADPDLRPLLHVVEAGWRSGRIQIEQGADILFDPDDRSRLRHSIDSEAIQSPLVLPEVAPEHEGPHAFWRFGADLARAGRAMDPLLGGGTYWLPDEDNPAHLRLPRAGSWVELPLMLLPGDSAKSWLVEVRHQAASRYHLPFRGQAWIRIELDGSPLVDRHLVQFMGYGHIQIPLEGTFLPPGLHTIRITVLEATTTYWLHQVQVGPPR